MFRTGGWWTYRFDFDGRVTRDYAGYASLFNIGRWDMKTHDEICVKWQTAERECFRILVEKNDIRFLQETAVGDLSLYR